MGGLILWSKISVVMGVRHSGKGSARKGARVRETERERETARERERARESERERSFIDNRERKREKEREIGERKRERERRGQGVRLLPLGFRLAVGFRLGLEGRAPLALIEKG